MAHAQFAVRSTNKMKQILNRTRYQPLALYHGYSIIKTFGFDAGVILTDFI